MGRLRRSMARAACRPAPYGVRTIGTNAQGRILPVSDLVGAWPTTLEADDDKALADFAARIEAAVLKAAREAKERTSWNRPDVLYETAIRDFVQAV